MTMIAEFVRGVVARRHVEKHEDYLVQGYFRMLREDNAQLRSEWSAMRPEGFTPSGRYVFVRVAIAFALVFALVAGGLLGWYSGRAAAAREGFREGGVAATSGG